METAVINDYCCNVREKCTILYESPKVAKSLCFCISETFSSGCY